jgi:3-(3-hydroxy-phenyl)propionate hydroxylase
MSPAARSSFDVAVVGLGPTGAVLAGLLAQRGVSVVAFDRLDDLYPLPRAIGFDHEFMRVMQELGVADEVLAHTAEYRPSEYRGVDGGVIRRFDVAPPPHRLGWAPNYVFDQPSVERVIRRRLAELPNVTIELAACVESVVQDPSGVVVAARRSDGSVAECDATYVIACDGGSSPIRKSLGITLEDLGFDEHWLVVDVIVDDDEVLARLPQTQVQYCEPARPSTFVVGPGRHRRWEVMLLPGDSVSETFPDDELWPLLARWISPGEAQIWRAAAYRFHGLVAERWRHQRVFLAGDSAHMTPPFMAQGMVQGTRDAQNLAWKLAHVLNRLATDELLDTYQAERKPHVEATTARAIELGRIICERDIDAAVKRDSQALIDQGGQVRTTIRQSLLPAIAHGLIAEGTPGAGQLLPQPTVHIGNSASVRLDDITGAIPRIITRHHPEPAVRTALDATAGMTGGCVVVLDDLNESEPILGAWFDSIAAFGAVVRPDHVVFGTGPDVDSVRLLAHEFANACAGPAALHRQTEPTVATAGKDLSP